jgi:transketolase
VIGFGSPNKQGKEDCHGAPLGDDEIALVRKELDWPHAPFEIPAEVYAGWDAKLKGAVAESAWEALFAEYQQAYPELAQEFIRRKSNSLPETWGHEAAKYIRSLQDNPADIATRKASQNALNAFGPMLPELLGGSADLAGSNLTIWSGSKGVSADDASGNYLYYGVREFGMSAMMNGITLYGGFKAYGATFLMFMEYARNAVRMAALMKQPSIFVYTHDSIGLGEDGPTHQPVEQVVALRATPNLDNWRPCDQVESAIAWKAAIERTDGPTTLIFTRQGLPQQGRNAQQLADVERGAYVLLDSASTPEIILIATGSEVQLATEAAAKLNAEGTATRVVSMPCTDVFDRQSAEYKESVLPKAVTKRVAVEALAKDTWYKYVGLDGEVVGMDSFGESAPAGDLFTHFNITADAVYYAAKGLK